MSSNQKRPIEHLINNNLAEKTTVHGHKKKKTAIEQHSQVNDIGKASIHMLNNDCLTHIFQFLPIEDRVRIERVCKRWRDLSQDSWRTIKRLDLLPSTWGLLLFTFTSEFVINTFHKVLQKCGRFLTQIDLSHPRRIVSLRVTKSILTSIGKLCPNITNIDITSLVIDASGIRVLARNCRNIRKLNLGKTTDDCNDELKNLFKLNQNLEYLATNKSFMKDEVLLYLPEQMHTIILDRGVRSYNYFFPMALEKLKNLKHLTIYDNAFKTTNIAKRTLEVLGEHCKNLTVLKLNGVFASVQTTDMLHLTHLVNLQVLKVTYYLKISDEFLANLERCQQLVDLDITGCCNISNNGLITIAALPKLEKLTISYIDNITDDGLMNMYNLKTLECRKCLLFSDRGISMFIKSSLQLELLDLSGCRNITESILEVAKDACDTRSNNKKLKMIVGGTSIDVREIYKFKLSPLLQIVEADLSNISSSILNRFDPGNLYSESDEDSDDSDSDFERFAPVNLYSESEEGLHGYERFVAAANLYSEPEDGWDDFERFAAYNIFSDAEKDSEESDSDDSDD